VDYKIKGGGFSIARILYYIKHTDMSRKKKELTVNNVFLKQEEISSELVAESKNLLEDKKIEAPTTRHVIDITPLVNDDYIFNPESMKELNKDELKTFKRTGIILKSKITSNLNN